MKTNFFKIKQMNPNQLLYWFDSPKTKYTNSRNYSFKKCVYMSSQVFPILLFL